MKYFFPHQLFGKREAYTKEIRKASLERLTHLIKVCSFLMQTKVYLFWRNRTNNKVKRGIEVLIEKFGKWLLCD